MVTAPLPENEAERLVALHALELLDSEPEERFDAIARLAIRIFSVPIAFVSLLDRDRQWFKARVGLEVCQTARGVSFCAHAILQESPLIVTDTLLDSRFADNPLVTGNPCIRFYAGVPLTAPGGEKIGTLCIADHEPRELPAGSVEILRELGAVAEREFRITDLLSARTRLLATQSELLSTRTQLEEELASAQKYVQSLLPPPRSGRLTIDWRFLPSRNLGGDGLGFCDLDGEKLYLYVLDVCGHGVGAALLSVAVLSSLGSQSLRGANFADPASVLRALNREFPMERHENRFFTIWYGVLDLASRQLVYASAGHPPAIVVNGSGESRTLEPGGIPVGCLPQASYQNSAAGIDSGDLLYLYSDGLYEIGARSEKVIRFDELQPLLARAAGSLDSIIGHFVVVGPEGGAGFSDDVTLLKLRLS